MKRSYAFPGTPPQPSPSQGEGGRRSAVGHFTAKLEAARVLHSVEDIRLANGQSAIDRLLGASASGGPPSARPKVSLLGRGSPDPAL